MTASPCGTSCPSCGSMASSALSNSSTLAPTHDSPINPMRITFPLNLPNPLPTSMMYSLSSFDRNS